ncbi:MAG: hypothetical protein R3E83_21100 [Burkholderiaceae bacterium]
MKNIVRFVCRPIAISLIGAGLAASPVQAGQLDQTFEIVAQIARVSAPNNAASAPGPAVGTQVEGLIHLAGSDESRQPLHVGQDDQFWPGAVKSIRVQAPLAAEYAGGNLASFASMAVLGTERCNATLCRARGPALTAVDGASPVSGPVLVPKTFRLLSARQPAAGAEQTIANVVGELVAGAQTGRAKLILSYQVEGGGVGPEFTLNILSMKPKR